MRVKFGPKFPDVIYHYDVDIQPEKKKYLYRKVFLAALAALFPNRVPNVPFDARKNAYSAKKLPIELPVRTTLH